MTIFQFSPSPLQLIDHSVAANAGVKWWVKRDDLYGPEGWAAPLQGNKVRKLIGHLTEWSKKADLPILTFGGAYSNHLVATAVAGKLLGISTIGIVRGEAVENPQLVLCKRMGMELFFVERSKYRQKHLPKEIAFYQAEYGPCYIVPEGGSGPASLLGTGAILPEIHQQIRTKIDYLQLASGTGGTAAGIINSNDDTTKIEAYPVLKGGWMEAEIDKQLQQKNEYWEVIDGFHFGGYAKRPPDLLAFCEAFSKDYQIPLEPIYTGKLFYGVLSRIKAGCYPRGSSLVTYHSGGVFRCE